MSKGFVVAENGHIVQMLASQSFSAAGTSDVLSMEAWAHASIICEFGAGSGTTITVNECTSFAASGATALTFRFAQEATSNGDVLDAVLAWASSITIGPGTAAFAVIEIDADELSDGFHFLEVELSDPGDAKTGSVIAVLSGGRYQEDITATVIA